MRRSKKLTILAAVMVGALIAGACGSLKPESLAFADEETRPARTVLRISTYTSNGLIDAVEQWEREHPTADVVIDRFDRADHHDAILERRVTATSSDIFVYDSAYSGAFRNRTDLFADLGDLGGDEFEDASLAWRWRQGVSNDGTLVALPLDVGGLAIAYRTDLLGYVGSNRLNAVTGWCDFIALGDWYSDLTGKAFLPSADDLFEAIINQAPLSFHNRDGQLIHSTNPAVRSAWDHTMRALGDRPLFDDPCPDDADILRISANLQAGSDEWNEALRDGQFAAVLAPASLLGTIQATAPSTGGEWSLLSLPGTGAGNRGGSQLAVNAESDHKELAYDLIAHLAEASTQLRAFRDVGNLPVAMNLYENSQLSSYTTDFFPDSPVGQIYIDSVTSFSAAPDGPETRLILDEYRAAVTRVESGNQTPGEAWNEAQWRIELLLE